MALRKFAQLVYCKGFRSIEDQHKAERLLDKHLPKPQGKFCDCFVLR